MIVVDIETTGINPFVNSIIEIGAIDFMNPSDQFEGQCNIWEGAEIDKKACEINGFSIDDPSNNKRQNLNQLLLAFIEWMNKIEDRTIAGHNVDFDISFLNESAKRYSLDITFGKRKVDQHSLVYAHFLRRKINPPLENGASGICSDIIMDYVGIPREPRPHIAINGAKYETEALYRIIYGMSVFDEFINYPIPVYLGKTGQSK